MLDTTALLDQIAPAAEAAAAAYGMSVLTRTQDEAAHATVQLGQRLIRRLLNHDVDTAPDSDPVRTAVVRLAEAGAGADPDMLTLRRVELRLALRTALTDMPDLAEELSALLPAPPPPPAVHAEGERSVAVGGNNSGHISTGDGAGGALRR